MLKSLRKPAVRLNPNEVEAYICTAYRCLLGREVDAYGLESHRRSLLTGKMSVPGLLDAIWLSQEYHDQSLYPDAKAALHAARALMVRQLPRARVILDLGGGMPEDRQGALVLMGYPYPFESLTIVEPPAERRHETYQNIPLVHNVVQTNMGPVRYLYHSMSDLSPIPLASVDLVFAGQAVEHATPEECVATFREVRRVLKPGGDFCLDTPNRALTRLQQPADLINPDHKHEYTHAEMTALLERCGFEVHEAKGIGWMPQTAASGRFQDKELIANAGIFHDIENCYVLYYRCRNKD